MSLPRIPLAAAAATVAVLPLVGLAPSSTFAAPGDLWAVTSETSQLAATQPVVTDVGFRAFFTTQDSSLSRGDVNNASDVFSRNRDGLVQRLSVTPDGRAADGPSSDVQVSADGRVVAFASAASNLWNSDHNGVQDIYACRNGFCSSVGWSATGIEPNGRSLRPRLSADGAWVAFASDADNWVRGDTNGVRDVFVANVRNGAVTRVSVAPDGSQLTRPSDHPAISGTGRYVTFTTGAAAVRRDTNGVSDVYLRDRVGLTTTLASQSATEKVADGPSRASAVAVRCDAAGVCVPTVAFVSWATNLVRGDTNRVRDVFVREAGSTGRASTGPRGLQATAPSWSPSLSSNGTLLAFTTSSSIAGATGGVSQVVLRDRTVGSTRMLSRTGTAPGNGASTSVRLSPNGKYAAFVTKASDLDTTTADNGVWDVVVTSVS